MFFVPLYIEILRSRPQLLFWAATLAQALIWLLVPMLFYAAPPGDVPQLLAIGHEFQFRGDVGPPLAYWLGEIAFRIGGLFGVYLLSQICVVVTYWCVFALGRVIVGPSQAALAVLLMVGISLFAVPTPEFGPPILAMALWALALLHYWQAAMLGQRRSWYVLGVAAALLLMTSDGALVLLGTLVVFIAATERGRATVNSIEPWIVGMVLTVFLFLHLLWLMGAGHSIASAAARLHDAAAGRDNTLAWLRFLAALVFAHAGVAIMVVLASGWPRNFSNPAPVIARAPAAAFAATFVKVFALAPALLATIVAVLINLPAPLGGAAPLVVLSGLAVVTAAGESIEIFHQKVVGYAWAGLLIVPALFVPLVLVLLPWTIGTDLKVEQPAGSMGRFFAESFERRTGRPLAVVSGDPRTAALVALTAPSRPSVYFDADPARSPWITPDDIRRKGAVIVWVTTDTNPAPPADIKQRFPDLVPEVPRAFDRPVRGRLPTLRIGWGMIRPGSVASAQ